MKSKPMTELKSICSKSDTCEIVFDDYVDVQTRLILLPLKDSECVGAVVASYTVKDEVTENSYVGINGVSACSAIGNDGAKEKAGESSRDDADDADAGDNKVSDGSQNTSVQDSAKDEEGSCEDSKDVEPQNNNQERNIISQNEVAEINCLEKEPSEQEIPSEHESENDSNTSQTASNTTCTELSSPSLDGNGDSEKCNETQALSLKECEEKKVPVEEAVSQTASTEDHFEIVGSIFAGIKRSQYSSNDNCDKDDNREDNEEDWTGKDFTSILSEIREAPTPIILIFKRVPSGDSEHENSSPIGNEEKVKEVGNQNQNKNRLWQKTSSSLIDDNESSDDDDDDDSSTDSNDSDCENQQQNNNSSSSTVVPTDAGFSENSTAQALRGRLKLWGSKVRSTSNILAAEAASRAASAAKAVNERAASERQQRSQRGSVSVLGLGDAAVGDSNSGVTLSRGSTPKQPEEMAPPPLCNIFLQTSVGTFVQLENKQDSSDVSFGSSSNNGSKPGNESDNIIRRNLFSKAPPTATNASVLMVRSSVVKICPTRGYQYQWYRSYKVHKRTNDAEINDSGEMEVVWYPLPGATSAVFQPSATDVGHNIKCVVTIDNDICDDISVNSYDNEQSSRVVTCELLNTIEADTSLFNAACQSYTAGGGASGGYGAAFRNLVGCGNAEGRTFRVHLEMGHDKDKTSIMTIFQTSGGMQEAIHNIDEPILGATAIAEPSRPSSFGIEFTRELGASAAMVENLSTNKQFQLKAPNRLARESFLLALGIANFRGKPSELNAKSTLFPDLPYDYSDDLSHSQEKNIGDDEKSSASVPSLDSSDSRDGSTKDVVTNELSEICPESPVRSILTQPHEIASPSVSSKMQEIESALEQDMTLLQGQLESKNKIISDLQRQLKKTNNTLFETQKELSLARDEAKSSENEYKGCYKSLRLAQKRIESLESDIQRVRGDFTLRLKSLEKQLEDKKEAEVAQEKIAKSLENEKAVLSAAVEARDGKLIKMAGLQAEVSSLKDQVEKGVVIRKELTDMTSKYLIVKDELIAAKEYEKITKREYEETRKTVERLTASLKEEKRRTIAAKNETENVRRTCQQLKADRNVFKQKADSIVKEMSRICRNGRSINDIENLIHDHELIKTEVALLKSQKRKALQELEEIRTAYNNSLKAHKRTGVDGETVRGLEQRAELERVISELTEYLNAKEMQLETMREVNEALNEEIRQMAKANFGKNDI